MNIVMTATSISSSVSVLSLLRKMYEHTHELHHAYLIETSPADILAELRSFLEKDVGIPCMGNPDFWHGRFETFGIDESRMVSDLASRAVAALGKRVFVVEAHSLSREAQNALLKTLEDTPPAVHFFLIMAHPDALAPTLRSRLMRITCAGEKNAGASGTAKDAALFLSLSYAKRLAFLKESVLFQDKGVSLAFLDALEQVLYTDGGLKNAFALEEIVRFRTYLYDRAPSVKMILEYLALAIPVQEH